MARFSAIEDPTFQRAMRLVSAITNANPAAVTTTFDHDYATGDIVRLRVPSAFGMIQIDKLVGEITVTGTGVFTVNIDTTLFDSFSVPASIPWYVSVHAQVMPVGEITANLGSATQNTLPH